MVLDDVVVGEIFVGGNFYGGRYVTVLLVLLFSLSSIG